MFRSMFISNWLDDIWGQIDKIYLYASAFSHDFFFFFFCCILNVYVNKNWKKCKRDWTFGWNEMNLHLIIFLRPGAFNEEIYWFVSIEEKMAEFAVRFDETAWDCIFRRWNISKRIISRDFQLKIHFIELVLIFNFKNCKT